MNERFYITTAIDYVNSKPHLGTAYEKIAADVIARYKRLMGVETFFLMGTDEHSINVARQAEKMHMDPHQYCNMMVEEFKKVWQALYISYNDFIRTTQKRHIKAVQFMMEKIYEKGDLYKAPYRGWYCPSCEAFLREKDIIDGRCPTHMIQPQWVEEENYFFRLSKYHLPVLKYIEENPSFILPETRRNEILNILREALEDLSVTRSSIKWGIPVPFDNTQTVYVWFDALINYISAIGYPDNMDRFSHYWPCNLHIIGKDIIRFHCIIWPAMLMSAGIELPYTVFGHGFVYLGGQKMSKTLGTAIDPLSLVERFGADAVRYFLIREVPFGKDGEFTLEKFIGRYNADLANDLGNLLQRVMVMIGKYNKGRVKKGSVEADIDNRLTQGFSNMVNSCFQYMEDYNLSQALVSIWDFVGEVNRYIESTSPWILNKEKRYERLDRVLYNMVESLRTISSIIEPVMPNIAQKIKDQLNLPPLSVSNLKENLQWGILPEGFEIGNPTPIFPKIS